MAAHNPIGFFANQYSEEEIFYDLMSLFQPSNKIFIIWMNCLLTNRYTTFVEIKPDISHRLN
jgi:hypothetical protein